MAETEEPTGSRSEEIGDARGATSPARSTGDRPVGDHRILRSIVVSAVVAAIVGSGAALGVARATGWGSTTVVHEPSRSVIRTVPADIEQVLGRVLPSIVSVSATIAVSSPTTPFRQGTAQAVGTGVVVSRSGEIVTNDHVVSGASSVEVTLSGSAKPLPARVVAESPSHDLALVKIEAKVDLRPATFAASGRVGDEVIAIGYALGLAGGPSVTDGIISATGRTVTTRSGSGTPVVLKGMLQTDAAISSGNSGGPLVDLEGRVLGINTVVATSSGETTAQNIGFAIPAATVETLLPGVHT